jgi:hypothetical protein
MGGSRVRRDHFEVEESWINCLLYLGTARRGGRQPNQVEQASRSCRPRQPLRSSRKVLRSSQRFPERRYRLSSLGLLSS